jgi:hypothetical protein
MYWPCGLRLMFCELLPDRGRETKLLNKLSPSVLLLGDYSRSVRHSNLFHWMTEYTSLF